MELLGYILLFNFIGSIISLLGGLLLLTKNKIGEISHYLSSFAAGTLLGTVFFDLLPEAIDESENSVGSFNIFIYVLTGILFFFLLERLLHWFHHHGSEPHEIKGKPIVSLVVIGDTIHNFVDGVAIAATFMINIPLGILTTIAIGTHEIPQEIGDFGILLKQGLKKRKVIFINIFSALASFLGVFLTFFFGSAIEDLALIMISLTAGFFLYIALSDLIPEIHHENRKGLAIRETAFLLLGVGAVFIVLFVIENIFHISG